MSKFIKVKLLIRSMTSLDCYLNRAFGKGPIGIFKKIAIKTISRRFNTPQEDILCDLLEIYEIAKNSSIADRKTQRDLSAISNFLWDGISYLWRKSLWGTPEFNKFMDVIDSPSKAGTISVMRWDYQYDEGDYWQTPKETYERINALNQFQGDCDDIARFLLCGLGRHEEYSNNSYMYVMWGNETGHATCAIEDQTITTIGTFHRIEHFTKNRIKVAEYWYPNLKGIIVYTQDPYTFELRRVQFVDVGAPGFAENPNFKSLEDLIAKMQHIDENFARDVLKTLSDEVVESLQERLRKKGINI